MKFDPHKCPKCGELPVRVVDHVLVHSPIEKVGDGRRKHPEFDYVMGEHQDVQWDTQELYGFRDEGGRVELACGKDHGWLAEVVPD